MRVLVCGSRHFNDINLMSSVLTELRDEKEFEVIIHGAARGADTMAGDYGYRHAIPVQAFPADWDTYGKRAGPIRNTVMLQRGKPDLVIGFVGPNSRGTRHMLEIAKKAGVPVKEIQIADTCNIN